MQKTFLLSSVILSLGSLFPSTSALAGTVYNNIPSADYAATPIPGGGPTAEAKANADCNSKYQSEKAKLEGLGYQIFSVDECHASTQTAGIGKYEAVSSGRIYFIIK